MSKGHHCDNIDEAARLSIFDVISIEISFNYFDVYCDHILDAIHEQKMVWKAKVYFTVKKWEKMSIADRKKHTILKCYACSMQYTEIQCSFPLKLFLKPPL